MDIALLQIRHRSENRTTFNMKDVFTFRVTHMRGMRMMLLDGVDDALV